MPCDEVYADALSQESSVFRERIDRLRERNKRLTRNMPLTIDLGDVNPRVFNSFVNWCHRYPKVSYRDFRIKLDEADKCLALIKVYVFGHEYGARKYATRAACYLKLLLGKSSNTPTPFISAAAVA